MKLNEELNKIMKERFCKDTVIDNGHNDFEDKNTIEITGNYDESGDV